MKKILVLLAGLFLFQAQLFSIELSLSLEPKFGYSNKLMQDFLYSEYGSLNSRLDYEATSLFKTGMGMKFGVQNFFLETAYSVALPLHAGMLYDSDWHTEDLKTSYSYHEMNTSFGCDFSSRIKYSFPCTKHISLAPLAAFEYYYLEVKAENGIAWKGTTQWTGLDHNVSWDSPYAAKKRVYGIDFYNSISTFYLGLEAALNFEKFFVEAKTLVSPYTSILSVDHHLNKYEGTFYQMEQTGEFSVYKFELKGGWKHSKKNSVNLGSAFTFSKKMDGNLYFGYFAIPNDFIEANESSSFKFSNFDLELSYEIKI